MNIVLIGYRGCGKSTVGRLLAERLGLSLVDTDALVRERFEGKTLREIWNEHGEPAFRACEASVVGELLRGDRQVISLGGGAAVQPQSRRAILDATDALRVYLSCDPDELCRRIVDDAARHDRPSHGSTKNSPQFIGQQLRQRDPDYRAAADAVIDVTTMTPAEAADRIRSLVDSLSR